MSEIITDYINLTNLAFMAKYPGICWTAIMLLVAVSVIGVTMKIKGKL